MGFSPSCDSGFVGARAACVVLVGDCEMVITHAIVTSDEEEAARGPVQQLGVGRETSDFAS